MGMIACFTSLAPQALQHLRDNPEEIGDFLYPDGGEGEPPHYLDLDKSWHGLHYLLTGEAYGGPVPLSLAILGGVEFGSEISYGAARFLTAEEVAAVGAALSSVTLDTLRQRFDPDEMEALEIYPQIWTRDDPEALDYVLQAFPDLQQFYAAAGTRGEAAILRIA